MPRLLKVRMVNFIYDKDNKFISDKTFDLSTVDGQPADALFRIENGQGKTVIAQLFLQPVVPRAKLQDRKLHSFLRRGYDHGYILQEWALDNSSSTLVIGLAVEVSGTLEDEENGKSKSARIYTFIHERTNSRDALDITAFPLSETRNSIFTVTPYEEFRKFLQNKKIRCYSEDQKQNYISRLAEYGIIKSEWDTMVKMNEVEGGIIALAKTHKTSDALLENYIIPCLMTDEQTSKRTLDDMFRNYAKSYAGKEDNIRLKSEVLNFIEKLKEYQPFVEKMFNANDEKQKAITLFADYIYSLRKKYEQSRERLVQLTETRSREAEKLNRIKAEMYSREYYDTKRYYDGAVETEQIYENQKQDAENRYNEYARGLNILNAALEYSNLCKSRNQESAYRRELKALDEGTQDSEILNTKYSLLKSAEGLKEKTDKELSSKTEEKNGYERSLAVLKRKAEDIGYQLDDERQRLHTDKGRVSNIKDNIDAELDSLGKSVMMMFDGRYSEDDINDIRSGYDEDIQEFSDKIVAFASEQQKLKDEDKTNTDKRIALEGDKKVCEGKKEELNKQKAEYQKAYNDVLPVLEHLNLNELQLFTDIPSNTIEQRIDAVKNEKDRAKSKADFYKEQLEYIENGQMHMPRLAIDYLRETGVSYQTGEYYLIRSSAEIRDKILASNPLVAYSVIVDSDKEQNKLLAHPAEAWIPSTVPIYTLSDIADMMKGDWKGDTSRFISKYEKGYFSDVDGYTQNIHTKYDEETERIRNLAVQLKEWEKERDILARFDYPAGYKKELDGQIDSINGKMEKLEEEITRLETRKNEIEAHINELRSAEEEQRQLKRDAESGLKEFNKICDKITQYEELSLSILKLEALVKQLTNQLENEKKNIESLNSNIRESEGIIAELNKKTAEYDDVIKELADTPEAELLEDDYSILLERYNISKKQYSDDRRKIEEQIEDCVNTAKKIENNLKRFKLNPEEYKSIEYSEEKYNEISAKCDEEKQKREHAEDQLRQCIKFKGHHANEMENALHNLRRIPAELLQPSEIGDNFDIRVRECKKSLEETEAELDTCNETVRKLETAIESNENTKAEYRNELEGYEPKLTDTERDSRTLIYDIKERSNELILCEKAAEGFCTKELIPLAKLQTIFDDTVRCITDTLLDRSGNKYYNLYERIDDAINVYNDKIQVFDIELRDVDDSLNQLVTNCCQRMARLHSNIDILVKKSAAPIYGKQKKMLDIDIPKAEEIINEDAAERIRQYITEQVVKYIEALKSEKNADKYCLGFKRLLNCYIGRENIQVKVFHIGDTPEASHLVKWEEAPSLDSGGQLDCVLIMLTFSILNYARSQTNHMTQDKTVLILDNPFAKMTSEKLVAPLFNMAKALGIQLICTTHVTNAAVLNGFNNVFQVDFKTYAGARIRDMEVSFERHTTILERHIEYMHYKTEQMSLF